jgi:hypothetical protein
MTKPFAPVVRVLTITSMVAALVVGAAFLRAVYDDAGPADPPGAATLSAAGDVVNLDLAATSSRGVAACLTRGFATDPADVEVLYGVLQRRLGGSNPVLVLRNTAGDIRLCDRFGGDSPSEAPLPQATAEQPVVFLAAGRSAWTCAGRTRVLDRFEQSTWLAVAADVTTVRQRFLVNGVPGPWFESRTHNGLVHLQSWLKGPQPASATYAEQFRVLDGSGIDVRQDALPTGQSPLPGCTAGGSAQIG